MAIIGNHMKITVHPNNKEKTVNFYHRVLGCELLPKTNPELDLLRFTDGFILGIFYSTDCLSAADYLKATWLEIKTDNVEKLKNNILQAGITELEYTDKNHFYFQAPEGQVYRIVNINES